MWYEIKKLTFIEASLWQGLDMWIEINFMLFSEEGTIILKNVIAQPKDAEMETHVWLMS